MICFLSCVDIYRAIKSHVWGLRLQSWDALDVDNKLKSLGQELPSREMYLNGKRSENVVISRLRIGHCRITHSIRKELDSSDPMI